MIKPKVGDVIAHDRDFNRVKRGNLCKVLDVVPPNDESKMCDSETCVCRGEGTTACYLLLKPNRETTHVYFAYVEDEFSMVKKRPICNCLECFGEHVSICPQYVVKRQTRSR